MWVDLLCMVILCIIIHVVWYVHTVNMIFLLYVAFSVYRDVLRCSSKVGVGHGVGCPVTCVHRTALTLTREP